MTQCSRQRLGGRCGRRRVLPGGQQAIGDDMGLPVGHLGVVTTVLLSMSSIRKGTTWVRPAACSSVLVKPVPPSLATVRCLGTMERTGHMAHSLLKGQGGSTYEHLSLQRRRICVGDCILGVGGLGL